MLNRANQRTGSPERLSQAEMFAPACHEPLTASVPFGASIRKIIDNLQFFFSVRAEGEDFALPSFFAKNRRGKKAAAAVTAN